jgi:hypothetical protein
VGRKISVGWWVLAWVAGMAPIVHVQAQQTPTCVWERVERAALFTVPYRTTPSSGSYTGLDSYGHPGVGKVVHPFLRVTSSGDISGYQVTATIKVVGLRTKIASLMRNDEPPNLNSTGFGYAHTFRGPGARHWGRNANPTTQWDGDDFVWTWTFTGDSQSSTFGDHSFTLDTWWIIKFASAPLEFKTSAYARRHTFNNALSYACEISRNIYGAGQPPHTPSDLPLPVDLDFF